MPTHLSVHPSVRYHLTRKQNMAKKQQNLCECSQGVSNRCANFQFISGLGLVSTKRTAAQYVVTGLADVYLVVC